MAKATLKLFACITKCHASRASGKLADETAEESCENAGAQSCFAIFTGTISELTGCPACNNLATMTSLADMVEAMIDGNNGTVYCASPSGAVVR